MGQEEWFVESSLAARFEGCWEFEVTPLSRSESCGERCGSPERVVFLREPATELVGGEISRRLHELRKRANGDDAYRSAGKATARFKARPEPLQGQWQRSRDDSEMTVDAAFRGLQFVGLQLTGVGRGPSLATTRWVPAQP